MLHRNVKATEAPVFDQSFADAGACVPFLLPIPTAAGAAEEPRGSSRVARDHSQIHSIAGTRAFLPALLL